MYDICVRKKCPFRFTKAGLSKRGIRKQFLKCSLDDMNNMPNYCPDTKEWEGGVVIEGNPLPEEIGGL